MTRTKKLGDRVSFFVCQTGLALEGLYNRPVGKKEEEKSCASLTLRFFLPEVYDQTRVGSR